MRTLTDPASDSFFIPVGLARVLTCVLLVLLFVGTLMPGSWKRSAEVAVAAPVGLSMVAHVVLFAGICFLLPHARPWRMASWHVLACAMVLALVTEGLQFLAPERHPELSGVAQDMFGAAIGWALGKRWGPAQERNPRHSGRQESSPGSSQLISDGDRAAVIRNQQRPGAGR